jgi:phage terminase large subunit
MPKLQIDPSVPLYAFADIGHSLTGDDWSWWFIQLSGRDILAHKYYANTNEVPKHYADMVLSVGDSLGMRVSGVYLPHDGTRKDRHGHTAIDDLEAAGLTGRVRRIDRTPNRWDSINDVRAALPNVWISQEGCGEGWKLGELDMPSGIDCLDYYTKRVEATTGMIKEEPVHDQYSHGADAFRTFIEAWKSGVLDGNGPLERQMRVADIVVNREPTQGLRRTSVPVYRTRR